MNKVKAIKVIKWLRVNYIYIFIFIVFFVPRVIGLGYDIANTDAYRWHKRSLNFLSAVKSGDFKTTYQSYHPGVTIMWLGSFTETILFKYQLFNHQIPKTLETSDYFPIIHFWTKFSLILVIGFLLSLQIFLITKIYSKKAGLLYAFLLSTEPFVIGIDRWFHLTSLAATLVFTSLLLMMYWSHNKKSRYLIIFSILFGFALLTKVSALIAVPVLLGIFIKSVYKHFSYKQALQLFLPGILVIFIFFPALWVSPVSTLASIYQGITGSVEGVIRENPYHGLFNYLYYPIIFIFKISPVVLVLLVAAILKSKKLTQNTYYLLLYIASYLVIYTFSGQKVDRYTIIFLSPIILFISNYLSHIRNRYLYIIICIGLVNLLYTSLIYFPNYSLYYSPMTGGPKTALNLGIYDNSGEYFAQSAFYLNETGNGRNVYLPYNIKSFSYYYKGVTQHYYDKNAAYIVYSLDSDRKTIEDFPNCNSVEKTFGPRNFDAVFVLKCEK